MSSLNNEDLVMEAAVPVPTTSTQDEDSGSPDQQPGLCSKEDNRWYVEKIIDHRVKSGHDQFLVKWFDWDEKHNSWEPSRHVDDCDELLKEFFETRPSLQAKYEARQRKRTETAQRLAKKKRLRKTESPEYQFPTTQKRKPKSSRGRPKKKRQISAVEREDGRSIDSGFGSPASAPAPTSSNPNSSEQMDQEPAVVDKTGVGAATPHLSDRFMTSRQLFPDQVDVDGDRGHAGNAMASISLGIEPSPVFDLRTLPHLLFPYSRPPQHFPVLEHVTGKKPKTIKGCTITRIGEPAYLMRFVEETQFYFIPHHVAMEAFPDVIRLFLWKGKYNFQHDESYNVHHDPSFNPLDAKYVDISNLR